MRRSPRQPAIHHYYARYLSHPSGVTDSINHWTAEAAEFGATVDILCARPDRVGNEFADLPRVRTVPHLGHDRRSWMPLWLFSYVRRGDVLVLHEGWVLANVVAAAFTVFIGARLVVVPHGVYERGIVEATRDKYGLRTALERWVLRRSAAVHVFYRGEEAVVRRMESEVRRFIVAANGAPAVPPELSWTGAGNYFLWIGRFDLHHKGLDNLVSFWARLAKPRPRLVLAGPDFDGDRGRVRQQVSALGLDDVISIEPRVSGAGKVELMRNCRAYLHPSRWESCSIMLLEMLAIGAPCLVSSTIHAATELSPVLRSVAFDSDSVECDRVLNEVDRNVSLGTHASKWANGPGSWRSVGIDYMRQLADACQISEWGASK